eukprot:s1269_g8.t1
MGRVWGIELLLPYTTSWLAGQSPFYHHRARSSGRGRASLVTSRVHLAGPLVRGPCFEKHGSQAKGYAQRAANLFQLAMSMFWDTTRAENGMACLQHEMWFDDFMEVYLRNAANLRRNHLEMLPHLSDLQAQGSSQARVPSHYRDATLRLGVFSLCDYTAESPMHWLWGGPWLQEADLLFDPWGRAEFEGGRERGQTHRNESRVDEEMGNWGSSSREMEMLRTNKP